MGLLCGVRYEGDGRDIASLGLREQADRQDVRGRRRRRRHQTGSLVYCDCYAEVAGLFLIKTQRLSVGLLQGLSDVLPVNVANLIQFSFSLRVIQARQPFLSACHLRRL